MPDKILESRFLPSFDGIGRFHSPTVELDRRNVQNKRKWAVNLLCKAPVAQGIEQWISNPLVAGSNPAGRASFFRRRMPFRLLPILLSLVAIFANARADEASDALAKGDYERAITLTQRLAPTDPRAMEECLRGMLATGRYQDAAALAESASALFPGEASVHFARYEALKAVGKRPAATEALLIAARTQPGSFDPKEETPANAAARARALQLLGADPKLTLDRILTAVTKAAPNAREPYLALGETALDKNDYLLASETLREANNHIPGDADILFGLARSFEDPETLLEVSRPGLEIESEAHSGAALQGKGTHRLGRLRWSPRKRSPRSKRSIPPSLMPGRSVP